MLAPCSSDPPPTVRGMLSERVEQGARGRLLQGHGLLIDENSTFGRGTPFRRQQGTLSCGSPRVSPQGTMLVDYAVRRDEKRGRVHGAHARATARAARGRLTSAGSSGGPCARQHIDRGVRIPAGGMKRALGHGHGRQNPGPAGGGTSTSTHAPGMRRQHAIRCGRENSVRPQVRRIGLGALARSLLRCEAEGASRASAEIQRAARHGRLRRRALGGVMGIAPQNWRWRAAHVGSARL